MVDGSVFVVEWIYGGEWRLYEFELSSVFLEPERAERYVRKLEKSMPGYRFRFVEYSRNRGEVA